MTRTPMTTAAISTPFQICSMSLGLLGEGRRQAAVHPHSPAPNEAAVSASSSSCSVAS